jgi:RHS repeat-associated protein
LNFWTSNAANGNRQNVLNAFAAATEFHELGGTLYREEFWLVHDRLGTPRMIVDKSGSLASVRRHDYLPFGEELYAGIGQNRTTTNGYMGDSTRQKFTGYENDPETGLNFAEARYQSPVQGRFTSVDPLGASANVVSPQSLNRYSYVQNDPTNANDPTGMMLSDIGVYQTANPECAAILNRVMDALVQQAIRPPTSNPGTILHEAGHSGGQSPTGSQPNSTNQRLGEIRRSAKPLAPGETAVPTQIVYIVADEVQSNGQQVMNPDGTPSTNGPVWGKSRINVIAVLDQGGNIMSSSTGITLLENVRPASPDAEAAAKRGELTTANQLEMPQNSDGTFYDRVFVWDKSAADQTQRESKPYNVVNKQTLYVHVPSQRPPIIYSENVQHYTNQGIHIDVGSTKIWPR